MRKFLLLLLLALVIFGFVFVACNDPSITRRSAPEPTAPETGSPTPHSTPTTPPPTATPIPTQCKTPDYQRVNTDQLLCPNADWTKLADHGDGDWADDPECGWFCVVPDDPSWPSMMLVVWIADEGPFGDSIQKDEFSGPCQCVGGIE